MSSSVLDFMTLRDPTELIVFGYTKNNYKFAVPVALMSLIRTFYNLWRRCKLSEEQIAALLKLGNNQRMFIPLYCFTVNQSAINLYLRAQRWNNSVSFVIHANWPSDIEYVSGYGVGYFRDHSFSYQKVKWFRSGRHNDCQIMYSGRGLGEELESLIKSPFIFYADITQIKYASSAGRDDFDLDPLLKMNRRQRHKLLIGGTRLDMLRSDPVRSRSGARGRTGTGTLRAGPWKFRCVGGMDSAEWSFNLMLDLEEHCALPLNTSTFSIKVTVRSWLRRSIEEYKFVNQSTVIVGRSLGPSRWSLNSVKTGMIKMDWKRRMLLAVTRVDLDIDMEIIQEFDYKGNPVEVNDPNYECND